MATISRQEYNNLFGAKQVKEFKLETIKNL